jgi:hypothetical protein
MLWFVDAQGGKAAAPRSREGHLAAAFGALSAVSWRWHGRAGSSCEQIEPAEGPPASGSSFTSGVSKS